MASKESLSCNSEIVEFDEYEFNLDDEFSRVENTQPKKKRKAPQDMGDKVANGIGKVGTTTAMIKTLERLVQAVESHNEAEKDEIEATSYVHGQYSIPNCIEVLKSLKEGGLLNGRQFSYALELLKDSQNRVLLMSLKDSMDVLVDWILYKYDL